MPSPGPDPDATPDNAEILEMEERWLSFWEEEDVHRFDPVSNAPVYAVDTPPPTVSGRMHIGHAYSYTQMDFMARYKRMRGFNLFYPFGFDDNGLPSERYTTKRTGVDIHDVSRKEFRELCLQETAKAEERMERSWRRIGTSCDWDLVYRTIEDHARRTSQTSFVELFREDLAYRKEDPAIWCPECRTAIAQVETEDAEKASAFHDLRFDLVDAGDPDHVVISTTRPELLPACVAVFVHPDDERSGALAGRTARVPLFDQEVPVLEDPEVDMDKGSGIVMCCTFGDLADIDWYRAHGLPLRIAIDEAGVMTEEAGPYEGLATDEARAEIVADLDDAGHLLDTEEIVHTAQVHERCGTPIEFLVAEQWFIDYLDHRDAWLERGEEIQWHPDFMKARYDNWVEGLKWDWCISRQRVFGVPFPVWYCDACEVPYVAGEDELPVDPLEDAPDADACPACGEAAGWTPEEDVMDTWATSSLTPQLATDWVDDGDLWDQVAPYDLRPQAHDIISFWAFNTIVKSHYHDDQAPWTDIMISGFVKLEEGKMSKSKGNIIEPLEVVEAYSGDALRYWAATGASLGEDIIYREKELVRGQRVLTKLENVQRFIGTVLEDVPEEPQLPPADELALMDRWILAAYSDLVEEVTDLWDAFDYTRATKQVEDFLWHTLADHYLELVKHRVQSGRDPAAEATLYTVGLGVLKMLAPVTVFRTEDIYQAQYRAHEGATSVHGAPWPAPVLDDEDAREQGELVRDVIAEVRAWKSAQGLPLNAPLPALELVASDEARATLEAAEATVTGTLKAHGLRFVDADDVEEVPVAVHPNHAHLGPTYRGDAPKVQAALEAMDPKAAAAGDVTVEVDGETVALDDDAYDVETRPSVHGKAVTELHVGDVTVLVREA